MKILYISPYYSTFIHDPILAIESMPDFQTYTFFPINLYLYIKRKDDRNNFKNRQLNNKIPKQKQKKFFYYGLPQDFNSHNYPKQIKEKIEKNCNIEEYDIIHAHTIFPVGVAAYLLAEKYEKPFIITSHGYDFYRLLPLSNQNHRGKLYNEKEKKLILNCIEKVSSFICVSERFGEHVKEYFPNIDVQVITNTYNEKLFNTKHNVKKVFDKDIIITTVGNFIPVKNHELLLKVFKELVQITPNIRLQVIGRGPLKIKYIKLCNQLGISEKVKIIDQLKHSDIATLLKTSDIYVHSSNSETFGLAIVEAMACGLPVISTKTQGPSSYIENEKTGLLVDKKNYSELKTSILKLINSLELREELGRNAAFYVLNNFSKYDKLVSLYKQIKRK